MVRVLIIIAILIISLLLLPCALYNDDWQVHVHTRQMHAIKIKKWEGWIDEEEEIT